MPLKHAILALVTERRGYGYELAQRFEERVGPAWRLNASAVYPALDQLERDGLVTGAARRGGTRRSPRVVYASTPAGEAALAAWRDGVEAPPEPVRADLHLRIAFAGPHGGGVLAAQLAAHERACAALLARYPRAHAGPPAATFGAVLVDEAVVVRLRAELAWAASARAACER